MTNRTVAVTIAISLLAGASAFAQGGGAGPPAAGPQTAAPVPAGGLAEGEAVVTRGESLQRRVNNMLAEARRESDIIRITCLNDKLTQVNANLTTAISRLEAARGSSDPDKQRHELTVLTVLSQKFRVLDQEAAQCVGQELFETGSTRVETDIDPATVPFEDQRADSPPSMSPAVGPGEVDNNVLISTPVSGTS